MRILTSKEAKEQGILTKRDLQQIVHALRYQPGISEARHYIPFNRRLELAEKLKINLDRAFNQKETRAIQSKGRN